MPAAMKAGEKIRQEIWIEKPVLSYYIPISVRAV